MAPRALTLFDLFGDVTSVWPSELVRERTGHPLGGPPSPAVWLAALNNSVRVGNVRTGAIPDRGPNGERPGRVAVEAELSVDPGAGFLGYPDGWPFVIVSMPDVELRIKPYAAAGHAVHLFAAAGADGVELVLEKLPVEILLPGELVTPHPQDADTLDVGEFEPGRLDDLRIVYRRTEPTSIFVHVRLLKTAAGEFHLQPAVPVSFGECALSAIPCRAVHDFRLIPSPELVPDHEEWVRHSVLPWMPAMTGPYDGLFAARSIHIDESAEALQDVADFLNRKAKDKHPAAELVLDDLVVPFFGPLGLPVPRHLTAGIRRRVLDPGSRDSVFAFERAPVNVQLNDDPAISFIVESFFYRSQPSETLDEDLGLTFSAAIVFGKDQSPQHAFEVGLEEDYTIVAGYRRDFTDPMTPAPGTGSAAGVNQLVHWEIAGTVLLDIMGLRAGFSLGRYFGAGKGFWDSALITGDIFVSMPPSFSDDSPIRLRSLNGEKVAFAMEGLGWRLGAFHFEGIAMPDGVVVFFGPVGVVFTELGVMAEEGASYLSFSGGLMIELPSGFEGGLLVRRLRFRVAGDETRPLFKLDGFFLFIHAPTVQIEAGGYYTDTTTGDTRVREFGLTGTVGFELGVRAYVFGADLIVGNLKNPTDEFDYLMVQAFFRGQIGPLGYFELTGARVLYARNMLPKLEPVDRESRDLRYLSWYKNSNPLTVPGDRRLASWRADKGSWAFGVGAGASLAGLGKVVELSVFVLGLGGPTEGGFLIVGELFVLANPEPLGFLAIEWDGKNDRFSMVVGVDAKPSTFVESAPDWLDDMASLSGTLFISNDPGTFAIGRLADQATWLGVRFDVSLWTQTSIFFGLCLEIVEGPTGPKGFGFAARLDGGINAGIAKLTYNAGFGFVVLVFSTGSTDYAVVIWIEAGIRFILFGFFRIGVSARAEFRQVGASPSRGELRAELRLETPWFLPDVTWTLEVVFGTLAAADLATATQPLRSAAATEGPTKKQLPTHIERFDPSWNGEGVSPVHSVNELRAPTRSEATRLANLANDTALVPMATDATIGIVWSVAVNDRLALGSGLANGLGDQRSGDLDLTYDLVAIAVRRRARFGVDRPWKALEQLVELGADFSDPNGVQLDGAFAPQVLNKTWDVGVQVGGQPAPKKLLINAVAPYEFQTADAEADEELVRRHPGWPCCERPDEKDLSGRLHEVDWRAARAGVSLEAPASWTFSDSRSTLRFLRPAWTHPVTAGGLPPGAMVAAVELRPPGVLARADLDQDAAYCLVRLAWPREGRVTLVAFDEHGEEVARKELGPGTGGHQLVTITGTGPIRRLEVRGYLPTQGPAAHVAVDKLLGAFIELDWVAYLTLRDALDVLVGEEACDGGVPGGAGGYEGRGKLAFLPNHEYELKLTTRVTVKHPSTPATSADVEEFVYVRTKGLPGLNAVARVGEEIEPYVRAAYTGGHGRLVYREEPVTLAFAEDFHVAVPLTVRPPGTAAEHTTLLRMQLLVTPDMAADTGTAFTATDADWVVAHRGSAPPPGFDRGPWRAVVSGSLSKGSAMITADPFKQRLAVMTQRPGVPCGLQDARRVVGTVLVAPPQGAVDPLASPPSSSELWTAGARFTAAVRAEGAGFVDRRPFAPGDETAFTFAVLGGPGSAASWSVVDGELQVTGAGRRFAIFGEPDWDHMTVVVGLAPGVPSAGVGFGLSAGAGAPRGLFASVEVAGGAARLVVHRREGAGALTEIDAVALPAGTATGADPVALEVTSFDDRLRAAVGDAVVEVDRGEVREGRLCLTAGGPAAFLTLQVRGLDMHAFAFGTSRYRSFEEHVGSWSGRLDDVLPDSLGPGTTTSTVSALWSATAADVAAAMAPAAPSADRERVFARWVGALGLPLKDDVTALELSRLLEGGQTSVLLVESPESLDFSEEIAVSLVVRKRVVAPGPGPGPSPGPRPFHPPLAATIAPPAPTSLLDRLEHIARPPIAGNGRGAHPPVDEAIRDVDRIKRVLRLELHPAFARAGELAAIAVTAAGRADLYRGRVISPFPVPLPMTKAVMLHAAFVEPLTTRPPLGSELAAALGEAAPGTVLLFTRDLATLLGRWSPHFTEADVPIEVRVIQSGDARRAIVVPISGAGAAALGAGRHRLTLTLERKRWETTEPVDDLNTYAGEATLGLEL